VLPYTAYITGGASGIGRALAVELGARGSRVLVCDIQQTLAEETAHLVEKAGGRAIARACDVGKLEDVASAADFGERAFGPFDFCANNAGIVVAGEIGEIPIETWRRVVDVNLWGVIHGAHVFTPRFRVQGRGKFLNVSSIAGFLATPETAPYNVTKSAVLSLSETMSAELGKYGIDTTVLCPSAVRTSIFDSLAKGAVHRALAEKQARSAGPRGPDEVARITLAAVDRGQLYVLPQMDAQALWLVKRMVPRLFTRLSREARTREWMEKLAGKRKR
jgi:NAD(P)-dependent dehydrogenase (short-subunit alcohol dehydrogenase family)